MTKTVGVFSFGRRQSERCPDKLMRPFGTSTLTRLMLQKLAEIGPNTFFAGLEDEFRRECDAAGVAFVQRDRRSATIDEPILDILSFLKDVDYDYLLWVNPCLPLLETATIKAFLDECIKGDCKPAFSVMTRRHHFLRADRTALNFDQTAKTLNTKKVEPVLEMVHAFYFYDRRFFLEHGAYWDWNDAHVIEWTSDRMQLFDIDEEHEFAYAERLWNAKHAVESLTRTP